MFNALDVPEMPEDQNDRDVWQARCMLRATILECGDTHLYTASAWNGVGLAYHSRELYQEAEWSYRRALAIYEKRCPPNGLDLAVSIANVAEVCSRQGKKEEAERLFKRALAMHDQTHRAVPEVAVCINNFAELYREWGKHEQAEPLYERSLAIAEMEDGDLQSEFNVLSTITNMVLNYDAQGKYGQAEPLRERALATAEGLFGPDNPFVAQLSGPHAAADKSPSRREGARQRNRQAQTTEKKRSG